MPNTDWPVLEGDSGGWVEDHFFLSGGSCDVAFL